MGYFPRFGNNDEEEKRKDLERRLRKYEEDCRKIEEQAKLQEVESSLIELEETYKALHHNYLEEIETRWKLLKKTTIVCLLAGVSFGCLLGLCYAVYIQKEYTARIDNLNEVMKRVPLHKDPRKR